MGMTVHLFDDGNGAPVFRVHRQGEEVSITIRAESVKDALAVLDKAEEEAREIMNKELAPGSVSGCIGRALGQVEIFEQSDKGIHFKKVLQKADDLALEHMKHRGFTTEQWRYLVGKARRNDENDTWRAILEAFNYGYYRAYNYWKRQAKKN